MGKTGGGELGVMQRRHFNPVSASQIFWPAFFLAFIFMAIGRLRGDEAKVTASASDWVQHVPANQGHGRTDIYGALATNIPNSGGKLFIREARIEQFPVAVAAAAKPDIIADSPWCIWDYKSQVINSAAPLQVHAAEGKLFVEGVGFLLIQKDFTLTLSNEVHTVIKNQLATHAPEAGTEIFSQRGKFEMKTGATNGLAIYQGKVQVIDPRMKLWCELLTAELPKAAGGQPNRIKHIVAETNVVIDFVNEQGDKTRAYGDQAVYDFNVQDGVTNELLDLTGRQPKVELTNGWMTATAFALNRTTGKLLARGNCHFHYEAPPGAASAGGNKTGTPAPSEIFSDNFEYDLEHQVANFWGRVRVDDARLKLTCLTLSATLPKAEPGETTTNRVQHILAETNVVIDFLDDKTGQKIHATGERAAYDYRVKNGVTNEVLELTGNPAVQMFKPAGWMTADVITVDRAQGKIWGVGNHHSVRKKSPGEAAMLDTEIFSDRFEFMMDAGTAVYDGKVREYDPAMNLTGDDLRLKFAKGGSNQINSIERADARGHVALDFLDKPFGNSDLTNLPAFAGRLQKSADPVAAFVAAQLTAPTRRLLAKYRGGADANLQLALTAELNRIIETKPVYEAARFQKVYLSLETSRLLGSDPLGVDLIQLNHLLLLDAFRGEIARNKNGEKTHATGETAIYVSAGAGGLTNAVLELSGHPRLEQPRRWITADDSIIGDRATGSWRAVGNSRSHTLLDSPTSGSHGGAVTSPATNGAAEKL